MRLTWLATLFATLSVPNTETPAAGSVPSVALGSASASPSSVVTSFLFGRRWRFAFLMCAEDEDLVTFDMRDACFMRRLSSLLVGKRGMDLLVGFDVVVDVVDLDVCFRMDFVGFEVR